MPENGLRAYGFHAYEKTAETRAIRPKISFGAEAEDLPEEDLSQLNPEAVARMYLGNALRNESLPSLLMPEKDGQSSEFDLQGIEESSLKQTKTVKFTQSLDKIPIYGALVTVEQDINNELVCLNSAFGEPHGVNPEPTLSSVEAIELLRRYTGYQDVAPPALKLSYYYQADTERWHLVYFAEDVFCPADALGEATIVSPLPLADYVIDAHDGQLVDILPRVCAANVTASDALDRQRRFETSFEVVTSGEQMKGVTFNVHTHDFAFQDVGGNFNNLPGNVVLAPPLPWNPTAVSAHANAELVADFLIRAFRRRGLDGRGGPLVSSVNCVWAAMGSNGRNWPNAFWIKNQVVYGQRQAGAQFRSFAAALDMVGHEFFHGVTQFSARLDLKGQPGALNESYSDIIGVIIANFTQPNLDLWRWDIGADTGQPLRNMRQPSIFGHPENMSQYQNLPPSNDFGGVHSNCGIHNKAAYNILTAKNPQGQFLFLPIQVAQIFYSALLSPLGPTALFSDSRRMVELQARTILQNDPQQMMKLKAIAAGFNAVGII